MTQAQLDRAVATATGEALPTIRRLGFSAAAGPGADLEPEELRKPDGVPLPEARPDRGAFGAQRRELLRTLATPKALKYLEDNP